MFKFIPRMLTCGVVGQGGGGAPVVPIVYLLRDQFTTDDAAPITSPANCEPGPGAFTFTDAGNRLSKSGGKFLIGGGTSAFAVVGSAQTRAAGLAYAFKCNSLGKLGATTALQAGFGTATTSAGHKIFTDQFYGGVYANGNPLIYLHDWLNIERYWMVLRAPGAFMGVSVGGHDYLLFVDDLNNTAPSPRFANDDLTTFSAEIDDCEIVQLDGAWATATGIAEAVLASPVDGSTLEALSSSVIIEFTWTPAANEVLELSWRYTDDNNRYYLKCTQATNAYNLYKVEGGVQTEVIAAAAVAFTADQPVKIYVIHDNGFLRTAGRASNGVHTMEHIRTNGAKTDIFNITERTVKITGFTTGANLIIWPRRVTLPAPWNTTNYIEWMSLGDSKALAHDWQGGLSTALRAADTHYWTETVWIGKNGQTVSAEAAEIDAKLLGRVEYPSRALINFGVNESVSMPTEAAFKTAYFYVLDALNTRWPGIKCYLARVWSRGRDVNCAILNGWINEIIAARSFAYAGHDESVWLEGGDNGVTMTTDGTHYSAAGITECIAQWKTALGL